MANNVMLVEGLSKQYRLGTVGTGTLSHDLNRWWHKVRGKEDPYLTIGEENDRSLKGSSEYVWALRDINFKVEEGAVLGIIGKNGAGKSTLLKLLSRTTAPTTGSIKIKGRIASLLEVGTGFHPELSGRDNIYLNGAILGMTRQEVSRKFDEIVEFAGVERYVDTPVKRYSSGMYVRLAFAVAAHLEPDILIVDEVLAVGDAEFQKKALGKLKDVSTGQGRTVLFVSHSMAAIKSLCTSGILMSKGKIETIGTTQDCIDKYLFENDQGSNIETNIEANKRRQGNGKIKFVDFHLESEKGQLINNVLTGENIVFVFKLKVFDQSIRKIDIGFSFHNNYDEMLSYVYSSFQDKYYTPNGDEFLEVKFCLKKFPFTSKKISIKGRVVADGIEADWLSDSLGIIDNDQGDFYNTGKISENIAPFLIKGSWH